jgi:hypothetical protein
MNAGSSTKGFYDFFGWLSIFFSSSILPLLLYFIDIWFVLRLLLVGWLLSPEP